MDSDPPLSRASRRDFIIAFLGLTVPRTPSGSLGYHPVAVL